jgi:tetratricopeptide (TPR) repeat protein
MRDKIDFENEEDMSKRQVAGTMMEAVENQLEGHDPAFVTDIFYSIQRKGLNRKQARTVIASVLIEEMYHILKGEREYDEMKYEVALNKRNRTITNLTTVPDVTLKIEEQIKEATVEIWDAISDDDEEGAAVAFLAIWPAMKEYVIHNLYRDTTTEIEKPDISDISEMTEYNMDFDSLLPEMGMILCNTHRYQQAIDFCKEVLELFSWERTNADSFKDDIGQALADMGKTDESDDWYQTWLEVEPDNGSCINGYAFCHQIRGDIEGAIRIVESHLPESEIADIKYEDLYIRAVDLYEQKGDNKKAEYFRKLLEEIQSSFSDDMFIDIEDEWKQKPVVKEEKIYPNAPCPCGSGKKFKKCCGKL